MCVIARSHLQHVCTLSSCMYTTYPYMSRVAQLQQYEERRLKEFEDALNREAVSKVVI